MLRAIGAVVAGVIVGACVNMGVLMLSWLIYPLPEGLDVQDAEQMGAYVAALPVAALLLVLIAHMGQALVGGWVAARLSASGSLRAAMIVGVIALMGGVANMLQIPHPAWMWLEVPLYLVCAWAAGTWEISRRAAAGASA